jgi:hypothetical protein
MIVTLGIGFVLGYCWSVALDNMEDGGVLVFIMLASIGVLALIFLWSAQ